MNARIVAACAALLTVALVVAGCSITDGQPVQLLTGIPEGGEDCHLMPLDALLVVDPKYGTAVISETALAGTRPTPMAWRPGFVGRRAGSEVEVLDPNGLVRATTGRHITYYPGGSEVAGVKAIWNCAVLEWEPVTPS